jgi:spore germination protein YaaH
MNRNKLRNSFRGVVLSTSLVGSSIVGTSIAEASTASTKYSSKFNMSYLFFGSSYTSQVKATNGSLNVVAPDYFEISKDGNLVVTSKYNQSFIDEMHREGLKVVPYISNNWNRTTGRLGLANRVQLVKQITDKINQYHLDGIDVDIEGLTEVDRGNFTDFIKLLNNQIPDKEVSVAVAANPGAWTNGWQGMYDYKTLSLNSDYLMIMAYDENWDGDLSNGPVAGLPWVEKSIQYALNQGISSNKLVLGIPFFGRVWKMDGPTTKGINVNGTGVSHILIDNIIQMYDGIVEFDEIQQTPKVTFTIKSTDPTSTVGGIELTAGSYTLWYDNQQSITKKIELVNKYSLKGTGSWSLNQEDPRVWDYFRNVLDQLPLTNSQVNQETSDTTVPNTNQANESIYKVVSGDSLSKIAKQYNITVQELKNANHLTTDVIKISQLLVIPNTDTTFSTTPVKPVEPVKPETPAQTPTPKKPESPTKTPSSAQKPAPTKTITKTITKTSKYKVVRGDSLSKIAKKYKITTSQIMKDNKLKSSRILIGQILKINTKTTIKTMFKVPVSTAKITSVAKPVIKSTSTGVKTTNYKVVRGDSLSKIAKKYKVTITQIKKINGLKSDIIRIGQILSIPK